MARYVVAVLGSLLVLMSCGTDSDPVCDAPEPFSCCGDAGQAACCLALTACQCADGSTQGAGCNCLTCEQACCEHGGLVSGDAG